MADADVRKMDVDVIDLIIEKNGEKIYFCKKEDLFLVLFSKTRLPRGRGRYIIKKTDKKLCINDIAEVYFILERTTKTITKIWQDEYKKIISLKNLLYKTEVRGERYTDFEEIRQRFLNMIYDMEDTIHFQRRYYDPEGDRVYQNLTEEEMKKYAMIRTVEHFPKYEITTAVSKKELEKLSKEEREKYLKTFLCDGYSIDDRITFIVKSGVVKLIGIENFHEYAKYRGHTLLIKNSKAGMTSISNRVGLNLSAASYASIEGYADRQSGTQYSVLHEQTGLVNFDEFLLMKENIVYKLYNFLEQGVYKTGKSAQIIENFSAAQCVFTANPINFEDDKEGDIFNTEYTNEQLLSTFRQAIRWLTTTSKAMGSRFGMVVFDPHMQTAVFEKNIDVQEKERAKEIIESLILTKQDDIKNVLENLEVRNWLESDMVEYRKKIYEMTAKIGDINVREFWRGHADAFRHIRGMALFEAILEEVILSDNTNIDEILETAGGILQYIEEINLSSLRKLCQVTTEKKITKEEILNLKPKFLLPILHTYIKITTKENRTATLREIIDLYNAALNEQERAKYAPYDHPSRFIKRIKIEQIKRILSGFMQIQDKGDTIELSCNEEIYKTLKDTFV